MPNITRALTRARALGLDRLDAQLLLLHALGTRPAEVGSQRAWLLAHGEDQLSATTRARFEQHLRRRAAGEPLAYITGHKEFFGLELDVDARVLVPRPDTETLVAWALEVLTGPVTVDYGPPMAALDLGTGSGAIALAIKSSLPQLRVDAVDVSSEALAVAQANAQKLGLQVQFSHGSWLDLVKRQYHCIVANPPYVAAHDAHLAALAYEPMQALVSGPDGLRDIRHIVTAAKTQLHCGGWLLIEHGFDQSGAVRALFAAAGYANIESRRDLGGHERCTGGQLAGTKRNVESPIPTTTP